MKKEGLQNLKKMLKLVILFENKEVWIEFSPFKFRRLLKKYFKEYKSIDLALDEVIKDIKKETLTK